MDERGFDGWVRRVSNLTPRRTVLWAMAGALTGALALMRGEARAGAGCKRLNRHCRKDRQCCTGHCRRGRCRR